MKNLERKIAQVKKKISEMQYVHPGKITKQFNVCGKAGCRCKDKENPKKHGPYYYLSYTFQGKGKTLFIPKELVQEVTTYTRNYQKLKKLYEEFIKLNTEYMKEEVLHHETRKKTR